MMAIAQMVHNVSFVLSFFIRNDYKHWWKRVKSVSDTGTQPRVFIPEDRDIKHKIKQMNTQNSKMNTQTIDFAKLNR